MEVSKTPFFLSPLSWEVAVLAGGVVFLVVPFPPAMVEGSAI